MPARASRFHSFKPDSSPNHLPLRGDECSRRPGAQRPGARHPRPALPDPAAEAAGPAAAAGGGDHLAPDPRPGRLRLQALDRADPGRAVHLRRARGRDRRVEAARDHVARQRAADRQRRRLHPARAGNGARRLVEHERLVDLRRHGGGVTALEVPDQVPRRAHLQPVELRPRPLLPRPRQEPRVPARVLVGADVAVDGARARAHRRRRADHPPAHPPARDRGRLLGHVRRGDRRARARRARDDRVVPPRADDRLLLLAGADHLAGDPRLHVLHDHRPEDDSEAPGRAARLRDRHRAAVDAADGPADDGIRHQGRAPRRAHARLRGAAAARVGAAGRARLAAGPRLSARAGAQARPGSASRDWPRPRRSPGCSSSSACRHGRALPPRRSSRTSASCRP